MISPSISPQKARLDGCDASYEVAWRSTDSGGIGDFSGIYYRLVAHEATGWTFDHFEYTQEDIGGYSYSNNNAPGSERGEDFVFPSMDTPHRAASWNRLCEETWTVDEELWTDSRITRCVAVFVETYKVLVVASPEEGGDVYGAGDYRQDESCTIKASANSGYAFDGWTSSKGDSASSSSHTFTVTEDVTWTAHFVKFQRLNVTATVSPTKAGTASGSGEYDYGAQCTVSASKRCSPWTFDHWEDDKGATRSSDQSYTFNVTESLTLIAKFTHPNTGEIMCDSQGRILSTADGDIIYNGDLVTA